STGTVSTLRQPFGFPLQLHLLARERLEPPFPLLFRESGVGEVALFAGERFLAFRQLADPIEIVRLLLIGPLLAPGFRLVIVRLPAFQLAVEECREVLPLTPAAAIGRAVVRLRDLAAAHFRLRAQQRVERGHLVRNRRAGLLSLKPLYGPR